MDNTTNILRLMLLLSLAIGVVLTRTLLQGKRTRWQQSPFLLTANKSVPEEEESEKRVIHYRKGKLTCRHFACLFLTLMTLV